LKIDNYKAGGENFYCIGCNLTIEHRCVTLLCGIPLRNLPNSDIM